MEVNGKTVLLDNFRELFKEYDIEIQDIVRSAVLDGVDISEYVHDYHLDPYKLDQIRLLLKSKGYSALRDVMQVIVRMDGQSISKIRKYSELSSTNRKAIEKLVSFIKDNNACSADHLEYGFNWLIQGLKVDKLRLDKIPKDFLSSINGLLIRDPSDNFLRIMNNSDYSKYAPSDLSMYKAVDTVGFPVERLFNHSFDPTGRGVIIQTATRLQVGDLRKFWDEFLDFVLEERVSEVYKSASYFVTNGVHLKDVCYFGGKIRPAEVIQFLVTLHKRSYDLDEFTCFESLEDMEHKKDVIDLEQNRGISGRLVRNKLI